jgi:hypothetical protein
MSRQECRFPSRLGPRSMSASPPLVAGDLDLGTRNMFRSREYRIPDFIGLLQASETRWAHYGFLI